MWVVGIDEAGYGPNLGPLVQAAVALRLPEHDPAGWKTHRRFVRRTRHKEDGRLLVDDSKKVYPRGGIEALERAVIHALGLAPGPFGEFLGRVALAACLDDLRAECWFDGDESLPLAEHEAGGAALPDFACACSASLVPATLFNQIVDGSGSKGTVLACGLISLMVATQSIGEQDEPIHYCCDKQGGRNFYAAMLQSAFPDGWVAVERESAEESRYRIDGLRRPVTIVFRPRADGDSISVALASMLCKYLREVCMRQFNRFWSKHVPDLAPTAGYPGDSRRYYDAIRNAMANLNLSEDQVWRKR